MAEDKSTRDRLLAAALDLVAEDGVQAVTHRAVEERAGAARGSTRYYFGSREQLLEALLAYLAARDHAFIGAALDRMPGVRIGAHLTPAENEQMLVGAARALMSDRAGALARFELFLYAARRPELHDPLVAWRATFVDVAVAHLRAQGAPDPEGSCALLVATLDGLVLHSLTGDAPTDADLGARLYGMVMGTAGLPRA